MHQWAGPSVVAQLAPDSTDHCIHHNATTTHDCTCIVGTETKQFPSWEAFMTWKEAEEESTYTCFVQPKGGVSCKSEDLGAKKSFLYYKLSFYY